MPKMPLFIPESRLAHKLLKQKRNFEVNSMKVTRFYIALRLQKYNRCFLK